MSPDFLFQKRGILEVERSAYCSLFMGKGLSTILNAAFVSQPQILSFLYKNLPLQLEAGFVKDGKTRPRLPHMPLPRVFQTGSLTVSAEQESFCSLNSTKFNFWSQIFRQFLWRFRKKITSWSKQLTRPKRTDIPFWRRTHTTFNITGTQNLEQSDSSGSFSGNRNVKICQKLNLPVSLDLAPLCFVGTKQTQGDHFQV